MVIRGKVSDIINVSDKVTQVVIMVKKDDAFHPICFTAFGDVKSLISQINLQKKDIIKVHYYVKSKKYENRYYTTAVLEKIIITEKCSPQLVLDTATGEIIDF